MLKKGASVEADYKVLGSLAEIADGRNAQRLSFQRFVLGALLDDVLRSANLRLESMSQGRFELYRSRETRVAGGLDLEVLDHHTGEGRPVATLSGGEGFLAALALALGLADVTENYAGGVRMETMFIDEGFGSLSTEALDLAFKTLYQLQEGGRLVGVISHVTELKERIHARLEVKPSPSGSSAAFNLLGKKS
jgi:exonuclease SbcC